MLSIELNQKLGPVRELLPKSKLSGKNWIPKIMQQFKALIENGDFEAAKEISICITLNIRHFMSDYV